MSNLTITVKPPSKFAGYPLAYTVYDVEDMSFLADGMIRVGESATVSVKDSKEYKVQLYLPTSESIKNSQSITSSPQQKYDFLLADELLARREDTVPTSAPYILIPPIGSELFGLAETSKLVPLGTDPFLLQNPFSYENSLFAPSKFTNLRMPIDTWQRNFLANVSLTGQNLTREQPGIPFFIRPFVRLWKLFPGEIPWRVDPASTGLLTDGPDKQRLLTTPARTQHCLEVGTPSGPNHFIYLPPGPLSIGIRAQSAPLSRANKNDVQLVLCSQSLSEVLLGYTRSGAISAARVVAQHVTREPGFKCEGNTALVLAYFCLRTLDKEQIENWLKQLVNNDEYTPDINVIQGWRSLWSNPPDVNDAQNFFVKAGLDNSPPVYTEGLRLLIDGLELFNAAENIHKLPKLAQALKHVQVWGAAADWEMLLTTLSGKRPDYPLPGTRPDSPVLRQSLRSEALRFATSEEENSAMK